MVYLGPCVAPAGQGKPGERCAEYSISFAGGRQPEHGTLSVGDLRLIPMALGETATIEIHPGKQFDVGQGRGESLSHEIRGGVVGVLLDGRGRPLRLPADPNQRVAALKKWHDAVNLYPK
jgi:hypothetical protein